MGSIYPDSESSLFGLYTSSKHQFKGSASVYCTSTVTISHFECLSRRAPCDRAAMHVKTVTTTREEITVLRQT